MAVALLTVALNFTFANVALITTEFEKHTSLGRAVRWLCGRIGGEPT